MNFPSPQNLHFILFVLFAENQYNILFVCMVADNTNYLRKFVVFYRKRSDINNNLHVLKSYGAEN